MAVTVDILRDALKFGDSTEERAELTRKLAAVSIIIEKHASAAPEQVRDEAIIMLAGYLVDKPFSTAGDEYAHALTNSGVRALLLPWRTHRAGRINASGSAFGPGFGDGFD